MTQEEKDLLIKDLCGRLPYGVKIQCGDYLFTFDKEHMGIGLLYTDFNRNPLESPKIILSGCYYGEDVKPYLFPLSSMTDEQCYDFYCRFVENEIDYDDFKKYYFDDGLWHKLLTSIDDCERVVDWFNKNHFDYRGLIPMDLAIDATGLKNIY